MSKNPYTSVTETVARILALLITLMCFSIYVLSKETQFLFRVDWAMLMVHLIVFWLAYEVFAFCFFVLLQQFAAAKELKTDSNYLKPASNFEQTIQQKTETTIEPKLVEPSDNFDK